MKHLFIFTVLVSFFNFSFGAEDEFKTTGQKLREQKISEGEICKMACESKFQKCYDNKANKAVSCIKEILICKAECPFDSGKK